MRRASPCLPLSLSLCLCSTLLLHFIEQVAELFDGDVGQSLAALVEALVDFDDRLAHQRVRLFRPTSEQEVLAAGDAFMAVRGVKRQTQQSGDRTFLGKSIRGHAMASLG